jgi:protein-S-isoprenylcysteine O-methyltransferase Ste14
MAFLLMGHLDLIDLTLGGKERLVVDACLCVAFFLQHSGMVRRPFQRWLGRFIPEELNGIVYGIASGVVLLPVMFLWQGSTQTVWTAEGTLRWILRLVTFLDILGFIWTVRSLVAFDPLGTIKVLNLVRGFSPSETPLVVKGPYRWVRHPLYALSVVLFWSCTDPTADRLLFNVLFTAWIVVGAYFEERDLVAEFGESYREYQRRVPMLVPWRGPHAVAHPKTT